MEPTSPKVHDLRERRWYALHNGVPDISGTGGEFFVSGHATPLDDPDLRAVAAGAATFPVEDRWVLFELEVDEARCNGYGDVVLPDPRRWTAPSVVSSPDRTARTDGADLGQTALSCPSPRGPRSRRARPCAPPGGPAGPTSRCG